MQGTECQVPGRALQPAAVPVSRAVSSQIQAVVNSGERKHGSELQREVTSATMKGTECQAPACAVVRFQLVAQCLRRT